MTQRNDKDEIPACLCEHANECPRTCPCPPNCYCRRVGSAPSCKRHASSDCGIFDHQRFNGDDLTFDKDCTCGATRAKIAVADEQPLPTKSDRPCIQDMVIADIERRKAIGLERYGTLLQAHNGRDALRDAYEEALDLCQYLRQVIEERDGSR